MADEMNISGGKDLRRREFLIAGAAAGVAATVPLNYAALARGRALPVARGGKFAHGVSSGFPTSKAITLWTRVSELDRSSKLTLEVAKDKNFRKVIKRQQVTASKGDDFTVHERINGLEPGHEYHYRFETKNKNSRVGKFRTLPPADSNQPLKIGYFSCQDYEAGYYNAQAAMAKEDLDLVICLGDYIYERMYYPGPSDRVDTTGVNGDGNVQTLDEYREKYHLYQSDRNLQALHAAHPFITIWDDHEVEDNYAGDQPDSAEPDESLENNGQPRRVPFAERRKNGYKAYFEAHPRFRQKGAPKNQIYGTVRLGGLAELFVTDQRQYRDQQPCADQLLTACPDASAPGRKFLGDEQKKWFKKAVPASTAKWKLWASEVMVMSVDVPAGQAAILDSWDGYQAERQEILESFKAKGVDNLAVLTGDIHTFIAGELTTTGRQGGDPIGVELVGGSTTSLGIPEALGVTSATLDALAAANDPHIKFAEFDKRGYCVLDVDKQTLSARFMSCDALTKGAEPELLKGFQINAGDPTLQEGAF
jgi:alkaline phosphatase D